MGSFNALDYLCLILYLVVANLIGFSCGRRQGNTKDFLLAGRNMAWIPLAVSMYASLFSPISYLGVPSEVNRYGFQYVVGNYAMLLSAFVAGFLFVEFYYRLNLFTVFEYTEKRFNAAVRTLLMLLFVIYRGLYGGLVIYTLSLAIHVATGFALNGTIAVIGVSTVFYTCIGGLRASIWTDTMQFFVMVASIVLIFWYLGAGLQGGWGEAIRVGLEHDKFRLANFDWSPTTRVTFWGVTLGGLFTYFAQKGIDQVNVQLYISSRSARKARHSLLLAPVFSMVFGTLLGLIGVGIFVYYLSNPDPVVAGYQADGAWDKILPFFVVTRIPMGLRGLIIAGLFAAAMSVLNSVLTSLSTTCLVDLYKRWIRPDRSDQHYLLVSRAFILGWGVLITLAAMLIMPGFESIVKATNTVLGLLSGIILGVFLLGMLSRRTNTSGSLIGAATALIAVLFVFLGTEVSFLWYTTIGTVVSAAVGYAASLFFAPPAPEKVRGLLWREVVWTALRRGGD